MSGEISFKVHRYYTAHTHTYIYICRAVKKLRKGGKPRVCETHSLQCAAPPPHPPLCSAKWNAKNSGPWTWSLLLLLLSRSWKLHPNTIVRPGCCSGHTHFILFCKKNHAFSLKRNLCAYMIIIHMLQWQTLTESKCAICQQSTSVHLWSHRLRPATLLLSLLQPSPLGQLLSQDTRHQ